MSVVYKARQAHPDRIVALKMILTGLHPVMERQLRVLSEADAIARLQHPHIVQIYEVGQHEHLPFLSLEFVNGGSLAQKLDGTPQLPRQAALLVEALAGAIGHAHQHGVVHRDLKPSNILLTLEGNPKISDFGLAKQDRPELTASGAILGTPAYMAPEQAAGDNAAVGPSADIYALGVILYELLTGRPPFRATTALETLALVRGQEPVAPRSLLDRTPRDLETICLKCLEKEPAKRYASAERLAADLRHFLRNEPIEARPSPPWERARKWMRRRPAAAVALGVGTVALLCLVVVWALFTLQLQRERDAVGRSAQVANEERARAETQRARAEANQNQALDAVDRFLAHVGDRRLAEIPEMEEVRRALLQDALRFCEDFLKQDPNPDRNVRFQAGCTYRRMAKILQILARYEPAEHNYRSSLALLEPLADEFPDDPAYRYHLAKSNYNLSHLYRQAKRGSEGEPFLLRAFAIQEHLVQENPSSIDYRHDLATTCAALAMVRRGQGRTSEAETLLKRSTSIREELWREQPGDQSAQAALTSAHDSMGHLLFNTHRVAESEKWFRQARDEWQALVQAAPQNTSYLGDYINATNSLGVVYEQLGRTADALAAYRQCVEGKKVLAAKHPGLPGSRFSLAWSFTNLGSLCCKAGQTVEAEAAFREGRGLLEQLAREAPKASSCLFQLAKIEHGMALLQQSRGLLDQAGDGFRRAAAILEPLLEREPENHACAVDLALAYVQLGNVLTEQDYPVGALPWFEHAFSILDKVLKQVPRHTFALEFAQIAHEDRAMALTALGRYDEARADWEKALVDRHDARMAMHHEVWQALHSAAHRQFVQAVSQARALDKKAQGCADLKLIYQLAQVYALVAAGGAQQLAPGNDRAASECEQCASRALELLHVLDNQKYFAEEARRATFKADAAFTPLRTNGEFSNFCRKLELGANSEPNQ